MILRPAAADGVGAKPASIATDLSTASPAIAAGSEEVVYCRSSREYASGCFTCSATNRLRSRLGMAKAAASNMTPLPAENINNGRCADLHGEIVTDIAFLLVPRNDVGSSTCRKSFTEDGVGAWPLFIGFPAAVVICATGQTACRRRPSHRDSFCAIAHCRRRRTGGRRSRRW